MGLLGSWADLAGVTGNISVISLLKGLAPACGAAAVTPSDSADLAAPARSLYIGGAGDLKVTTVGGDTVSFVAIPAGTVLPVAVKRVFATGQPGTIASAIVALT